MRLSFDPFVEFASSNEGKPKQLLLTDSLSSLHEAGRWIWKLGQWETEQDLKLILNFKNSFINFCVRNQSGAWFAGGRTTAIERSSVRDIDWLDDGLRRELYQPFFDELFDTKTLEKDSDSELGHLLLQLKTLHPSRMYWAHSLESVSNAYKAWTEKNAQQLVRHSIEAGEALRQGLGSLDSLIENFERHNIVEEIKKSARTENSRNAANVKHVKTYANRKVVIAYWREHIPPETSNEKAGEWLHDSFPKLSVRKLSEYVAQAKKEAKEILPASKA